MFRKIVREIAVFVFYTWLIIYFLLVYCLISFLIDCFMGTKIANLFFLIQKELERCTEYILIKVIRELEKGGMWY